MPKYRNSYSRGQPKQFERGMSSTETAVLEASHNSLKEVCQRTGTAVQEGSQTILKNGLKLLEKVKLVWRPA
jgi:hypothetical protein